LMDNGFSPILRRYGRSIVRYFGYHLAPPSLMAVTLAFPPHNGQGSMGPLSIRTLLWARAHP
jgi:hypothetical protein